MVSEPFAGNQIDRNSPVPLFLQIRQALLADIRSWPDTAAQFPTDLALAQRFSVSKMTVRQAIDDLVEAGLLERHRGRGTFVTDRAFVEQLDPVLDIDQQYAAAGHSQTTRVLSFDRRFIRLRPKEFLFPHCPGYRSAICGGGAQSNNTGSQFRSSSNDNAGTKTLWGAVG